MVEDIEPSKNPVSLTQEAFLGLWRVLTLESGLSIENPNGKSGVLNFH